MKKPVMKGKLFNQVEMEKPNSNMFDLSHDVLLSCNMGQLIPIMVQEVIPGDKFHISCEALIRFAPLVSPVMHRFYVTMHYFFVPNRLVWPNWEKWITENPETVGYPAAPYLDMTEARYTLLCDYLGIPNVVGAESEIISALPFAAFQMIYNEYYRDQNLISEIPFELTDGDNTSNVTELCSMRRRAWEHDYFTSALPFAQKGNPVDLPIGQVSASVPVYFNSDNVAVPDGDIGAWTVTTAGGTPLVGVEGKDPADVNPGRMFAEIDQVDVSPTTIEDLRRAFRLQEFLEKNARGGTRYIENILVHFGVQSSDKRLQRPEYITGIKTPVMISEVLNTTGTEDLPQGNMAGHGISAVNGGYGDSYFAEEHGFIIGVMSIMPKTVYQQGLEKHWLKWRDKYQYFWKSFEHIGEEPIENRELYAFQGATGGDTFGYIPRYADYRFKSNRVAGDFRTSLDFWTSSRIFSSPPALNQTFIDCIPDDRIFAVQDPDVQKLYVQVVNKVVASRKMSIFGSPSF